MEPATGSSPRAAAPAASRRNRTLITCAVVVAVLGLAFVATLAGVGFYLMSTPRQVPVASVVGPETIAVLRVRGRPGDPGIAGLVRRFADAMTSAQTSQGMPPSMQWIKPLMGWYNRQGLSFAIPTELGVVIEPDPSGSGSRTVTLIALRQFPRMHQWMFTWMLSQSNPATTTRRGGVDVVAMGPGAFVALTRGTIFLAGSQDALGAVLDRLASPPPASAVGTRLAAMGADADGDAVVLLGRGAPIIPDAPGCEALTATIDVVDSDRIDIHLETACAGASAAERDALVAATWAAIGAALPQGVGITPAPGGGGAASVFGVGSWMEAGLKSQGHARSGTPPARAATPPPAASPAAADEGEDPGENPEP